MKPIVDSPQAQSADVPKLVDMTLKKQLQFFCELRGLTPAALSRKSGVSKQVLSLWLNNAKPKNVDQVKSVADALGTTIDNLLFGSGVDRESEKITDLEALLGSDWIAGLFEVKFRRVKR